MTATKKISEPETLACQGFLRIFRQKQQQTKKTLHIEPI